jgi:hypothetical protein
MTNVLIVAVLLFLVQLFGDVAPQAFAADAVVYEVTEGVQSSKATLTGAVAAGTALCPTWLATQRNIPACTIMIRATGKADDAIARAPPGELLFGQATVRLEVAFAAERTVLAR